jgi:hypothetical protein
VLGVVQGTHSERMECLGCFEPEWFAEHKGRYQGRAQDPDGTDGSDDGGFGVAIRDEIPKLSYCIHGSSKPPHGCGDGC